VKSIEKGEDVTNYDLFELGFQERLMQAKQKEAPKKAGASRISFNLFLLSCINNMMTREEF
jgi:hypothetical protein